MILKIKKELFEWIILLNGILLFVIILNKNYSFDQVSGYSMFPTYTDKEFVVSDVNFKPSELEINDVIAFKYMEEKLSGDSSFSDIEPDGKDYEYHIKRIIAKPGDVVSFAQSELYVNDELVITDNSISIQDDVVLGEGEYYVVGDNYDNSYDSRSHGPIRFEDIEMKILFSHDNISDSIVDPRF